ncbi:glycogenin [Pseudoscourfieldia marina]
MVSKSNLNKHMNLYKAFGIFFACCLYHGLYSLSEVRQARRLETSPGLRSGNDTRRQHLFEKETGTCVGETEPIEELCSDFTTSGSQVAWITFMSSDAYLPGVYGLFVSLLLNMRTTERNLHDLVALVTCGVSTTAITELCSKGYRVVRSNRELPAVFVSQNSANSSVGRRVAKSPEKLFVFLAACLYERIIYLDADMQVQSNLRVLTRRRDSFAAVQGQETGRFNAGLFVYKSNHGITRMVLDHAAAIPARCSFGCKYFDAMSKNVGDQGILNVAFRNNWQRIPHEYNVKAIFYVLGREWGRHTPPLTLVRTRVAIVHWIGKAKPWNVAASYPCTNLTNTHAKFCFCPGSEPHRHYDKLRRAWWLAYHVGITRNTTSQDMNQVLLPEHLKAQPDKALRNELLSTSCDVARAQACSQKALASWKMENKKAHQKFLYNLRQSRTRLSF